MAILLPRTDELPQPSDAPYTTPSVNTEGLRLLVLEDDEPVASTLTQMLTKLGCVVFTANNTEHALVIVDEHPPDVIIADVILAERRSGLDFLNELRVRNKKIPALLISGYAPESIGFEVPRDIALLSKPISTTQLAEAISQARLKQY